MGEYRVRMLLSPNVQTEWFLRCEHITHARNIVCHTVGKMGASYSGVDGDETTVTMNIQSPGATGVITIADVTLRKFELWWPDGVITYMEGPGLTIGKAVDDTRLLCQSIGLTQIRGATLEGEYDYELGFRVFESGAAFSVLIKEVPV